MLTGVGLKNQKMAAIIPGNLFVGFGLGLFFSFFLWQNYEFKPRIGILIFVFAIGWFLIPVMSRIINNRPALWAIVPGGTLASLGYLLISGNFYLVDSLLYLGIGLGSAFLIWGILSRMVGLIITGCLIITTGPGVYFAWKDTVEINNLAQTGIMLVIFAFGWGLITLFSRIVLQKFTWWPLIPGGVLAMVGWGLYIGGNPSNALSFIGNTGSLGLIIFGLYLLMWRRGLHK
jgi:hypothetical protein